MRVRLFRRAGHDMWHTGSGIMATLCYYVVCAKLSLSRFFFFLKIVVLLFFVRPLFPQTPSFIFLCALRCAALLIPSLDNVFRLQEFQMLQAKHYARMTGSLPGMKSTAQL